MHLRLLEIAAYAAFTDDKRIFVAGIFNGLTITKKPDAQPEAVSIFPMPPSYLVWIIDASLAEGLKHRVGLAVRNDDGDLVLEQPDLGPMDFILNRKGRPLRFQGRMAITNIPLPGAGDYEFHLMIDGNSIGHTTLYVDE